MDHSNYTSFDDVSWAIQSTTLSKRWGNHRQSIYDEFLLNCRRQYGDTATMATSATNNTKSVCDMQEEYRLKMNRYQPRSMRNFTAEGFVKTRAPSVVQQMLQQFWNENAQHAQPERTADAYHNPWETVPSFVNVLDQTLVGAGLGMKVAIANAVREVIEEWTGMRQVITSLYGIRIYHNNSILAPHVDRMPLVASAIINVAQDVDEDWVLEIYDHYGRAHNVTMKPWDMVLYESHACIHGRPFKMRGNYFANLFIHFEPIGPLRHAKSTEDDNDVAFPPYLLKGSPWEPEWRRLNPNGWVLDPMSRTEWGDLKGLRYVAERSPESLHKEDYNGWQPIHLASRHGNLEILRFLIEEYGISPWEPTRQGSTPLVIAQSHLPTPDHPVIQYLKEAVVDEPVGSQNPHGEL